jgi:outer membrane protein assembly factor BamB
MRIIGLLVASLVVPAVSWALLPGGGPAQHDCHAEFSAPGLALNWPAFDPAKPKAGKEVRCFDGDAGCDADGTVNHECRFAVDVCLRNADPALPACTAADVVAVTVAAPGGDAGLTALHAAANGLLPATSTACTAGQAVTVPLKGPTGSGAFKRGSKVVKVKAGTASATDSDKLKLTCVPRDWPSHGYDHRNHRATGVETIITPANASLLTERWSLAAGAVTSTPTVGEGMVYVTSWDGILYAVRAKDGVVRWTYDTGSGVGNIGLQSSATLTADGRVLVGDSNGTVHCLSAKKGKLLWTATVGGTDPANAHIWASPVVANGRVFMGRASHSDVPCTQGHLYAFDLDSGAELWRYATVPARVCDADTNITCTVDGDCPGGTCVDGKGGGVTASVAVSPDGETVYMASVGCYTYPSIGNSDAIFALDAATGAADWIHRTQTVQQFADGPPYHDYGFLNGPLLVDGQDGIGGERPLVVAASKDGSIYALDPATGSSVWTRVVAPAPSFAGFGLFNAAVGYANHRFYAALYQFSGWPASNDHLFAFDDEAGATEWSAQIGASWGSMAVANGVLFVGTNQSSNLLVYDAATGASLNTLATPGQVTSGASIVGGTVYVGHGPSGPGGVRAFALP